MGAVGEERGKVHPGIGRNIARPLFCCRAPPSKRGIYCSKKDILYTVQFMAVYVVLAYLLMHRHSAPAAPETHAYAYMRVEQIQCPSFWRELVGVLQIQLTLKFFRFGITFRHADRRSSEAVDERNMLAARVTSLEADVHALLSAGAKEAARMAHKQAALEAKIEALQSQRGAPQDQSRPEQDSFCPEQCVRSTDELGRHLLEAMENNRARTTSHAPSPTSGPPDTTARLFDSEGNITAASLAESIEDLGVKLLMNTKG